MRLETNPKALKAIENTLSSHRPFAPIELDPESFKRLKSKGILSCGQWFIHEPKLTARLGYFEHAKQSSIVMEFPLTKILGDSQLSQHAPTLLQLNMSVANTDATFGLTSERRLAFYFRHQVGPNDEQRLPEYIEKFIEEGVKLVETYSKILKNNFGFDTDLNDDRLFQLLKGKPIQLSKEEMELALGGWRLTDSLVGLGVATCIGLTSFSQTGVAGQHDHYVRGVAASVDSGLVVLNNFHLNEKQRKAAITDIEQTMNFILQYCQLNPDFLEKFSSELNPLFKKYSAFIKAQQAVGK